MDSILVGSGTILVLGGLAGLVYCIVSLRRSISMSTDDSQLRERIRKVLPIKLASFCIAMVGLAIVLVSILI